MYAFVFVTTYSIKTSITGPINWHAAYIRTKTSEKGLRCRRFLTASRSKPVSQIQNSFLILLHMPICHFSFVFASYSLPFLMHTCQTPSRNMERKADMTAVGERRRVIRLISWNNWGRIIAMHNIFFIRGNKELNSMSTCWFFSTTLIS